ncbi:MAG: Txe/YoeB family addiction module toxin [Gemmatimonas sp.]
MSKGPNAPGSARSPRRAMVVDPLCHEDLRFWVREQPRIAEKIMRLMAEVIRDPFSGTGKPEPLKGLGTNVWSRRITQEHRLVYRVSGDRIDFLQARYHY